MAEYYRKVAAEKPHLGLDVSVLPPKCDDAHFVKSLNDRPGILALAMREADDGKGGTTLKGIPFVVPGARFNEVRPKYVNIPRTEPSPAAHSYTTGILILFRSACS